MQSSVHTYMLHVDMVKHMQSEDKATKRMESYKRQKNEMNTRQTQQQSKMIRGRMSERCQNDECSKKRKM